LLSTHDLQTHLQRLSWKPGWRFDIREHPWEGPEVHIVGSEPDTEGMGELVDLGVDSILPVYMSLAEFERWMQKRLDRIAIHESHEWFKRDGVVIFDPHKPDTYRHLA
jgi:hypothetical protein